MGGFKSNSDAFFTKESSKLDNLELTLCNVILNRGNILAPVLSGDLVESGRIEKNPSGGRSVIYGGGDVPYGRKRHFENKKNPQTLHYLKRAGDSVAKESPKKYMGAPQ